MKPSLSSLSTLCLSSKHLFLEDTGFGGIGGGDIEAHPKKQLIRRTSDLGCFLDEYFSTFKCNSYVDTILTWLKLAMIRQPFSSFEKRKFFGEEGVSNIIKNPSWVAVFPKCFRHQERVKRFSSVSSFLKFRSLCLTQVIIALQQQVSTVNISFKTLYNTVQHCTTLYNTVQHCTTLDYTVQHCT